MVICAGCCKKITTQGFLEPYAYNASSTMNFDMLDGERQNYVASVNWMEALESLNDLL